MAERKIDNIRQAIISREFPTVTLWNRLEGRPRTEDFDRALRAEIRDPLWMLTRQWQLGEFQGDDAGSPVFARIHYTTAQLDGYQPRDHPSQPFDDSAPLEARVERRAIPFTRGVGPVSFDIRLLMGRQWLKLVSSVGDFRQEFITQYPIERPDPTDAADAEFCAHNETWQQIAAAAGRAMDGYRLYRYLKEDPAHHAYDGTSIPAAQQGEVDLLAGKFVAWFEDLFYQPEDPHQNAWDPQYLEYQFAVSAPDAGGSADVFSADEYYHGHLDWCNLDVDPDRDSLNGAPAPDAGPASTTLTFIPTPLTFDGMPHTRWWTFEDSRTNFGDVNPDTTDLSKLMLMEFGLIYANDWFLFPLTLPAGTLTEIKGLSVTDVFGERRWIEAAGRGRDEDWQRWNMYTMAVRGREDVAADMRFLLLPTVPKIQEGKPLETAALVRDEMANMVWGIETRVMLADGRSAPGAEVAADMRRYHERLISASPGPPPPEPAAPIRYQVMSNNVPENWIPFIPVRVPGSSREIQLQRAALPRTIPRDPDPPQKIRPRSFLLREGLDEGLAYFVHEEEVPRAGTHIMQSYQRTRWYGGRVFTWLGVRKQTGRGEGASNLRFDQIVPTGRDSG